MADTSRQEQEMKKKAAQAADKTTDPVEKLRLKCLARGASGIKGIGRLFRIMDDDGSKSLDVEEFKKGVHEYGMTDAEARDMFSKFDTDGSGTISFDEFLQALRPPMTQSRVAIVQKAFQKLDKTGDGVITVEDLQGVYNARDHPKVRNGKWTDKQAFEDFLKTFDSPNDPDGKITKEEFLNYYSGVSASIDNNAYFDDDETGLEALTLARPPYIDNDLIVLTL
jgi:Ca2+-binding EF-hand superfamily protein